jgi:hypothetical protein
MSNSKRTLNAPAGQALTCRVRGHLWHGGYAMCIFRCHQLLREEHQSAGGGANVFFRRIAVCPHYVQREQGLEIVRIGAVLSPVSREHGAFSLHWVCPRKLRLQLHEHNEVLSITVSNCYKMRNSRRPFKTHSAGVYSSSLQVCPGIIPRKAGGGASAPRRDYHLLHSPRKAGGLVSRSLYILAFDPPCVGQCKQLNYEIRRFHYAGRILFLCK